jgi:hypothetical protein
MSSGKAAPKVHVPRALALAMCLVTVQDCSAADIHVSARFGADTSGTGTAAQPFATIPRASAHARALRVGNTVDDIIVHVAPGSYAPFSLTAADSGSSATARTIIRGQAGSVVSGGLEVPPSWFKPSNKGSDKAQGTWSLGITGSIPGGATAAECNGTATDAFRVRAVAAGSTEDPRAGACLKDGLWTVKIKGVYDSPTLTCHGAPTDTFRVRAVASGGPDDPRKGACNKYKVPTQNILEVSRNGGKTFTLADTVSPTNRDFPPGAIDCGNDPQTIASSVYQPITTQNIVEVSHDGGRTFTLAPSVVPGRAAGTPNGALDCGDNAESITSSSFAPASPYAAYVADITGLGVPFGEFGAIAAGGCIHGCPAMPAGLSFGDQRLTIARWPNLEARTGNNVYHHAAEGCGAGCFTVATCPGCASQRLKGWAAQGTGWIHGYFEWDWADCYRKIEGVSLANTSSSDVFTVKVLPADSSPKPSARFYALNLLSELGETLEQLPPAARHISFQASTATLVVFSHIHSIERRQGRSSVP